MAKGTSAGKAKPPGPFRKKIRKILRSPKLLLLSSILVVLAMTLVASNKGLWRHLQLKHEIAQLDEQEASLLKEEEVMTKRVALLRKADPAIVERIARERYRMKKPGEIIYRLKGE